MHDNRRRPQVGIGHNEFNLSGRAQVKHLAHLQRGLIFDYEGRAKLDAIGSSIMEVYRLVAASGCDSVLLLLTPQANVPDCDTFPARLISGLLRSRVQTSEMIEMEASHGIYSKWNSLLCCLRLQFGLAHQVDAVSFHIGPKGRALVAEHERT